MDKIYNNIDTKTKIKTFLSFNRQKFFMFLAVLFAVSPIPVFWTVGLGGGIAPMGQMVGFLLLFAIGLIFVLMLILLALMLLLIVPYYLAYLVYKFLPKKDGKAKWMHVTIFIIIFILIFIFTLSYFDGSYYTSS